MQVIISFRCGRISVISAHPIFHFEYVNAFPDRRCASSITASRRPEPSVPLPCYQPPLYVDITAKAQGYMDVLAFYSFLRKNLISRCQRKAIFHFPRRPVYMHIDMLRVDHLKASRCIERGKGAFTLFINIFCSFVIPPQYWCYTCREGNMITQGTLWFMYAS